LTPSGPESAVSNCNFGPEEVIKKYVTQAPQSK
jgi:hypothetical protein